MEALVHARTRSELPQLGFTPQQSFLLKEGSTSCSTSGESLVLMSKFFPSWERRIPEAATQRRRRPATVAGLGGLSSIARFNSRGELASVVPCQWGQERERCFLTSAAAAVAVSLAIALSLPDCAFAEVTELPVSSSQHLPTKADIHDTQLSPAQASSLTAELRALKLVQSTDLSNGTCSMSKDCTFPLELSKSVTVKGASEMQSLPSKRIPQVVKSTAMLVPARASAVGSVVSAAGNAMTQSSVTMQHAVAFPGVQLIARALQHLGGGGLAGAVGASVVYPLDTIKTRMQAQSSEEGQEPKYESVLDCFGQLLDEEGLGSLYSGLVPQLLGIAPEKALKLTVNEIILEMLEHHLPGARLWALEFIAGGGGGFSQVLVTNPMEIVKLRLQIQSKVVSPKGLWQVVRELGFRGLYSGTGITLARDVPSSGIFFAGYALLTQMYPEHRFWAGFLAAIPATIIVTPLDVIKTRLQMETPPGEEPYKNAWHCFQVLMQKEGLKGLFKGGLIRVLRTSPQFGITLLVYSLFCDKC